MLKQNGRRCPNPDQIRIKLFLWLYIGTLYGSTKFEMNRLEIAGVMNF